MRSPSNVSSRPALLAVALLAVALMSAGCGPPPEIRAFSGNTMGSTYEVKFVGELEVARVQRAVEEVLAEFDVTFSRWRDDSEIMRCNRAFAAGETFAATPRLRHVLGRALEIARATDGAFDPTVGPLLALYRDAKDRGEALDPAALDAVRSRVGFAQVAIDGATVRAPAGVELDLDGIVAGACLDELDARLVDLGLGAFYLNITGETWCRGEKAPGQPWRIGVVDPRSDFTGGNVAFEAVALRDAALCTSGDYRNAILSDGRIVHHVFDPRTGRSSDRGIVSASVRATRAADADALGTALLVLGEAESRRVLDELAESQAISALLLVVDEQQGMRAVRVRWPEEQEE